MRSFLASDVVSIPTGVLVVIPTPSVTNLPACNPVNAEPSPAYDVAVTVPDTFIFCRNVAFVLVLMLSVDATPVNAEPSPVNVPPVKLPENVVAVTTPV